MNRVLGKTWFMPGPAPIRRTVNYLEAGKLIFKDRVKIMDIHYNMYRYQHGRDKPKEIGDPHLGLKEFYFWNVPQIQYKNPAVQIVRFTDHSPSPFIRCWLDDGRDVIFDCDSKTRDEILYQVIKVLGKSKERLDLEKRLDVAKQVADNPSLLGYGRERFCSCEIPGQVPCPGVVDLPMPLKAKYKHLKPEELEKYEQDAIENPPKEIPWERKFRSTWFENYNVFYKYRRRWNW